MDISEFMRVFLIQTSGADIETTADPAYVAKAEGPRFCDEPLRHLRYFNADPYWSQGFRRRRAWQTADDGDIALLYCTGSVDRYSSSLSHVLPIAEKRIVEGIGAWLEFYEAVELEPTISYRTLQDLTEKARFSSGMGDCGREGFNIRPVAESDYETVKSLTTPHNRTWDSIEKLIE